MPVQTLVCILSNFVSREEAVVEHTSMTATSANSWCDRHFQLLHYSQIENPKINSPLLCSYGGTKKKRDDGENSPSFVMFCVFPTHIFLQSHFYFQKLELFQNAMGNFMNIIIGISLVLTQIRSQIVRVVHF